MESGAFLKTGILLLAFSFTGGIAAAAKPKSSLAYQYYSRGVELSSRKKWDDALKQFQSAIDLNPSFVTSYIEYARTSVMLGHRQAGLEKLVAAMEIARTKADKERVQRERDSLSDIFYTNDTFQQYQNGLNYMRLERSGSAIDSFERALKTEPDNLLVLAAYGRALRLEERSKEALSVLERALSLNDSKRDVRLDLAEVALSQKPERTFELLQPLLVPEADERTVILKAQALASMKRSSEAIEALRELYDKQPSSVYAPYWLGKLYEKDSNGAWNARKYLMTFLRRTEPLLAEGKDDNSQEARQLKNARADATQILARVNSSLD